MQTITFNSNNVSAYKFDDAISVVASADNIITPNFIIGDMNTSNATVHTGTTVPDDWQGGKYTFDGTTWAELAGWVDPKVAEIARLQAEIDALTP